MKDNTYYFSHDFHARKDPKCIALIKDFGMSGYGLYWSLVEMLYEQGGKFKKFPSLYSALSHEFGLRENVFTKQIEAMLHKYELLLSDENYIWSDAVLRRLAIREEKRNAKSQAGYLGGIKSGESRRSKKDTKQNEAVLRSSEANEANKRKGKERKGNVFVPPSIDDVKEYFKEKGYTEVSAETAFEYYNSNDWCDRNGNKVTAWKQKMVANWFKPEYKIKVPVVQLGTKKMVL